MTTIGDRLDAHGGIGPGFDTMRVLLAFAVIGWHAVPLTIGSQDVAIDTRGWVVVYAILPVFFALSGFLVTGSALRLSLAKFVTSRALRIVPALAVDTLVTILVIGPLVTTLTLGAYFTHPQTWAYLWNIVGEIHFTLPGVFTANPLADIVNGSLWTIPAELGCYLAISLLIGFGLVRRAEVVAMSALLLFALLTLATILPAGSMIGQEAIRSPAARLIGFFLLGSAFYLARGRIPWSPALFAASLAVLPAGALLGDATWMREPLWILTTALPLTYAMAFLGLARLPALPGYSRGDYSYGIYLYGYPIQQTIVHFAGPIDAWQLFAATLIPVTLLAIFSWHIVEKPTLRLRRYLSVGTISRTAPAEGIAPAAA